MVTGSRGQVAQSLAERASGRPGLDLTFVARPDFDLADTDSIRRTLRDAAPDVVVSAAAYTAVDRAEDEPDLVRRINAVAPGVLAETCAGIGARLVHLSTDYVFDGTGTPAHDETAPTGPQTVYGRTKLEGEEAVRATLPDHHVIVRTAWVYSPFGANFVRTILRLAGERDELSVVSDQVGNPTCALDIADGLLAMIGSWQDGRSRGLGQTFHLAGTGDASWFDLASHVVATSGRLGGPAALVRPIPSEAYPQRAYRPRNSRLDSGRFEAAFGYRSPDWRVASEQVVGRLLKAARPE